MATFRSLTRVASVSSSLAQRHLPAVATPTASGTSLSYLQSRYKSHSSSNSSSNSSRKWRGAKRGSGGHHFSRAQTQSIAEPQLRPTKQERVAPRKPKKVEPFSSRDYGSGMSETAKSNARRYQVMTGSATAALASLYILYKQLTAKEEEEEQKGEESEGGDKDGAGCDEVGCNRTLNTYIQM